MIKRYGRAALALGTILSGSLWASQGFAQDIGQQGAPAESANQGVEDLVVTARKRSERQRDVPVSIESFSGSELTGAKIVQIIDLQSRAPSLTISTGLTQPFIGIRGFGSGNSQSFDQAVGKFIDNVSYGRDQDARLPLFDIERVEVLKGPQVLLYGNSTTAGALNITTRKPGSVFAANGSAAYEFNNEELVLEGGVTVPLAEAVSLRVSGLYQSLARGSNYNVTTGKHVSTDDNYAGRAILRFTPASNLEILLKAEIDHVRNAGAVGEIIAQPISNPTAFPDAQLDGRVSSNNNIAPFFAKDFIGVDNQTYQADINLDILGGTLSSTTAYRNMHVSLSAGNGTPIPIFNGMITYNNKQFSEELRYGAKFDKIDLVVGGFYQHEDRDSVTVADFNFAAGGLPFPPLALNLVSPQKAESLSAFVDLTYHFTDQFSLEVGARYSDIRKTGAQSATPGNIVPGKRFEDGQDITDPNPALNPLYEIVFGVPAHSFTKLRLHETHFQPQVVAQYKFSDKGQIYAKYVKGAKAGGIDVAYQGAPGNVIPAGATFAPEEAEAFEVGIKGLTAGNTLEYALTAFHTEFTNLQTNAYVGQATVAVVTNVGKARTQGLEAELHYVPVTGLRFNASAIYTDVKYLDFPGGSCTRAQIAALPPFSPCVQDLSGTRTPYSSKWTGSLGVEYTQEVGALVMNAGALVVARSKFNVSPNAEPLLDQSGFAQIDAHIDLHPDDERWTLSVFGRNLTNKRVLEYGSVAPGTDNALLGFLSRGRQIGVRAGFKF